MSHSTTIFDSQGNITIRVSSITTENPHDLAIISMVKHEDGVFKISTNEARELINALMRCYFNERYPTSPPIENDEPEENDDSTIKENDDGH